MELEPIELPTDPTEASAPSASANANPANQANPSTNTSPFDLEAYIARYDPASETRLQRLLLIGSQSSQSSSASSTRDTDTSQEAVAARAYRLAEAQCRAAANVRTYRQVFGGGQASVAAGAAAGSGSGEATASGNEESSAAMMIPPELLEGNIPSSSSANSNSNATTLLPAALPHNPAKYGLAFDATFATTTDHTSQLHLQTLEARLSQAQSRLAKDAIRTAYLALAEHYRLRGDLRGSLRHLLRSRDFCTHTRQSGTVCKLVIELGVDMRNFALVKDYVAKAEHTTDLLHTDPLFAAKLRAASGLALLAESRYAEAARKFATVHSDLTTQFSTVLSAEDLALYGALLGMAALDRSELQDLILDSATFKGRLELIPPVREALRHYVRADYGPALALLADHVRPLLELDLHLRPHAEALLHRIRDRCIVQYLAPYSKVSLVTMAEGFAVPPTEMERIVSSLVKSGKIRGGTGAKINALEQTLVVETSARYRRRRKVETRKKIAKLGRTFVDEAEGLVLRLSCVENGLVVSEGRSGRGGGFGGGGGLWAAGGAGGGAGGRRGRSGRSGRGGLGGMTMGDAGGGGGGADAAMMMAYGIDDDSSSDDDDAGGHYGGGGGDEPLPDMDLGGDGEEMSMDVDDYANPEGGI